MISLAIRLSIAAGNLILHHERRAGRCGGSEILLIYCFVEDYGASRDASHEKDVRDLIVGICMPRGRKFLSLEIRNSICPLAKRCAPRRDNGVAVYD
jgi:hypothetical protein